MQEKRKTHILILVFTFHYSIQTHSNSMILVTVVDGAMAHETLVGVIMRLQIPSNLKPLITKNSYLKVYTQGVPE